MVSSLNILKTPDLYVAGPKRTNQEMEKKDSVLVWSVYFSWGPLKPSWIANIFVAH